MLMFARPSDRVGKWSLFMLSLVFDVLSPSPLSLLDRTLPLEPKIRPGYVETPNMPWPMVSRPELKRTKVPR